MKDVLLHLNSYPEMTSVEAIEQAVRFAATNNSTLSALAVEIEFKAPSNWLAERLINLNALCAEQEALSVSNCQSALAEFSRKLATHKIEGRGYLTRTSLDRVGEHVAIHARTRDLCLVPVTSAYDGQRSVAEVVAFDSGRPVLYYRPGVADLPDAEFANVVIAWDGSRSAARAMADALPLLQKAREVWVITVLNEKDEAVAGIGAEAVRHLQVHQVHAVPIEVEASNHKVGQVLSDYCAKHRIDLLVMGAFGRSRMREFLLGGATDFMLNDPQVPLLISH
jgi:nucleotide-binding universal stress UspA family protein